jgi:hypothetical protein
MKLITKLWIGIGVLIILCPLGLIIPGYFKASGAWGEWEADELEKLVGYVPKGFKKLSSLWKAPMPNYAFKGWQEKGLRHLSFAYVLSALLGIIVVVAAVLIIGKMLTRKDKQ